MNRSTCMGIGRMRYAHTSSVGNHHYESPKLPSSAEPAKTHGNLAADVGVLIAYDQCLRSDINSSLSHEDLCDINSYIHIVCHLFTPLEYRCI